jgi:hypothetical protein
MKMIDTLRTSRTSALRARTGQAHGRSSPVGMHWINAKPDIGGRTRTLEGFADQVENHRFTALWPFRSRGVAQVPYLWIGPTRRGRRTRMVLDHPAAAAANVRDPCLPFGKCQARSRARRAAVTSGPTARSGNGRPSCRGPVLTRPVKRLTATAVSVTLPPGNSLFRSNEGGFQHTQGSSRSHQGLRSTAALSNETRGDVGCAIGWVA